MNGITRRSFLGAAIAGGVLCAAGADAQTRRPNVLVILTDDHVYRAIGYNNPVVKTPHIDALARAGTIFDRAYIASPICVASRASLLTGHFPQQHGTVGLDTEAFVENVVRQQRFATLPQRMGEAGYVTAFAGKSHLGPPRDYGFALGDETNRRDPEKPNYHDLETFRAAEALIPALAADERPYFLWLGANQPHIPLRPEQRWLDLYDEAAIALDPNFREAPPEGSIYNQGLPGEAYYRDGTSTNNYGETTGGPPRDAETMRRFIKGYYATLSHLDDQIGRFIAKLDEAGLFDNTVVVFIGDNGYHLGNHGLGNKITMHEESVRVPMFISGPGVPKGERDGRLASSLDVFPTVLALAGAEASYGGPGRDLFSGVPPRDYVASECVGVGGKPGMGHRMVRTDRWKYVLTDVNDEGLFDGESDPYEMVNLAADPAHTETLAAMRARMNEWMDQTGDTHARPPGA